MRKFMSVLLTAVMLLSICVVGISAAPEGTAITTAEEFKNMAVDGKYYLANDITLTETYAPVDADNKALAFTGVFDGNGKTVTVSAPMFAIMNGTVKNLTIAGKIESDAKDIGALAATIKTSDAAVKVLIENVTNKVDIICTVADGTEVVTRVGGIVGYMTATSITIKGCTNYGNVTAVEAAGGIVGETQIDDATYGQPVFEECVNYGAITSTGDAHADKKSSTTAAAGGINGYHGTASVIYNKCVNYGAIKAGKSAGGIDGDARKGAEFNYCSNFGSVTANSTGATGTGFAGGMTGYVGDSSCVKPAIIDHCINTGAITGGNQVGGFVGYVYGNSNKGSVCLITNSINTGKVSFINWGSEFIGYTNDPKTTIKNSIGAGEMAFIAAKEDTNFAVIYGCSSNKTPETNTIENVLLIDNGFTKWFNYATGEANIRNRIPLEAVLGENLTGFTWKSGETEYTVANSEETPVNVKGILRVDAVNQAILDKFNAAAGETLAYLDGGKITNVKPAVVDNPSTPTGDYAIYAVVAVAVVATLGMAYISKKRIAD